ncbi:DUF3515 domain-containing protein [Corynebacterium sp. TAE3-ERU12]|uniref:DUF3515 domain-containing protein n=1 Tax=Corynebacterium sp. TAE3-ERU12 TaxID=2849491 RepID=UPI001C45E471|nr:DUF3515 domain-containing protein [Corynebacterium sp. TAE3-ERU12]MBV7295189.1 DUF3515 domain-containing protein [Corynebacterium sp. TAE3-ERU12]
MADDDQVKGNRRRAAFALVLAIVLAAGVIGATKVIQDRAARGPVLLPTVEMPDDDSAQCSHLMDALPDSIGRLMKADLMDPKPQGAAVYRDFTDDRITVRCGAPTPAQYTKLSRTFTEGGVEWLAVTDDTPELDLVTWFSVGASPVVAVTGSSDHKDSLATIAEAMGDDFKPGPKRQPIPLMDIDAPQADGVCDGLFAAMPDTLADRSRTKDEDMPDGVRLPDGAALWMDDAGDAITMRCGVQSPQSYAPGEQLTQVGEVVWFTEPTLSSGTTAAYFALGRQRLVAVHMPVGVASGVLPEISAVIAANLDNTAPSELADGAGD